MSLVDVENLDRVGATRFAPLFISAYLSRYDYKGAELVETLAPRIERCVLINGYCAVGVDEDGVIYSGMANISISQYYEVSFDTIYDNAGSHPVVNGVIVSDVAQCVPTVYAILLDAADRVDLIQAAKSSNIIASKVQLVVAGTQDTIKNAIRRLRASAYGIISLVQRNVSSTQKITLDEYNVELRADKYADAYTYELEYLQSIIGVAPMVVEKRERLITGELQREAILGSMLVRYADDSRKLLAKWFTERGYKCTIENIYDYEDEAKESDENDGYDTETK